MRSGKLLVFSGLDGAGKSTQIKLLMEKLRSEGQQPVYVWLRGGYTPGFNFLKNALRRGLRGRFVPPSGPSTRRTQAFTKPKTRRVWLWLALIDLVWICGVQIRWWLRSGQTVVCDRYLEDTLIDFRLNFPDENVEKWGLWRLLVTVAPRPDAAVLLLVPVEESLRRSREKDEPFPDTPEVLASRLAQYEELAKRGHWRMLDGRRPLAELRQQIYEIAELAGQSRLASLPHAH